MSGWPETKLEVRTIVPERHKITGCLSLVSSEVMKAEAGFWKDLTTNSISQCRAVPVLADVVLCEWPQHHVSRFREEALVSGFGGWNGWSLV